MNPLRACAALLLVLQGFRPAPAAGEEPEFRPLFNGKDLEGWVAVNTAPSTWAFEDGMLVCSGKPIGEIRTSRMYQNFILELEWRHMVPRGNAGVFVWADDITARGVPFHRGIEVQVLESAYGNSERHTTHGDIFPIHGATMIPVTGRGNGSRAFPTEFRSRPSPEWNHYRITCIDGEISLAVNGAIVTRGRDCKPRKGYICIESEGGVVHYRNARIAELPDSPIAPEEIAIADRGYRALYTGVDLSGWKEAPGWEPRDWQLVHEREEEGRLETRADFGDFGFIVDVALGEASSAAQVLLRGSAVAVDLGDGRIAPHLEKTGAWNRFEGTLRGDRLSLSLNGKPVLEDEKLSGVPEAGPLALVARGPVKWTNIYVRALD